MSPHLPNSLTLLRIALIPVIVTLFFLKGAYVPWITLGVYALACATDYFDGFLARFMNQASALGRFMDPSADKLLVATIVLMLVAAGQIEGAHVLAGLVILLREIMVSGLREFLAETRISMPVSRLAKWKTGIQMVALGVLIVAETFAVLPVRELGLGLLWLAAILTFMTGVDYLRAAWRHIMS